jgi:Protein of unknown function (DUF2380)
MRGTSRALGAMAALVLGRVASIPFARAEQVALAVADFDYADSSSEVQDQSAAHAARLKEFARLIRDELSANGKYQVVTIACPKPRCSAGAMDAASLTEAARLLPMAASTR